eukprot:1035422_1
MAEQMSGIVTQSFTDIQFAPGSDKYDVNIQYNCQAESLWIQLLAKTRLQSFEQMFTKEKIASITTECKLSAHDLYQLIIDQLSSNKFIQTFCRLFILSNVEHAMQKRDEFQKLREIPDGIGATKELEGKPAFLDTNSKRCALLLIHFSPSKYIKCNYCFIIAEKELKDSDRFMIQINALKQENQSLKHALNATKVNLTQQIQELSAKLQNLESKLNTEVREHKTEEIDLNLINNWSHYHIDYAVPKAFKHGKVVYLQGLLKGGSNNSFCAVLPEGWRPDKENIFCACQDAKSARINVQANGAIRIYCGYVLGWIPLEGVVFHVP